MHTLKPETQAAIEQACGPVCSDYWSQFLRARALCIASMLEEGRSVDDVARDIGIDSHHLVRIALGCHIPIDPRLAGYAYESTDESPKTGKPLPKGMEFLYFLQPASTGCSNSIRGSCRRGTRPSMRCVEPPRSAWSPAHASSST